MANILIVDDDRQSAEHVGRNLMAAGHSCAYESRGENAYQIAKNHPVDLLVLDVMLPDVSGFEICRRIRRDPQIYTLPVLMISAMNSQEEILHGLAQGADDYMPKPFDLPDLLNRVESLLRLNSGIDYMDDLTGFPGADATKREIQRQIGRGYSFAVAYIELLNIREFGFQSSNDARLKAIRHLSRAIRQAGSELEKRRFYAGHMGGGHFVALLPANSATNYCERVNEVWNNHLGSLYESVGQQKAYARAQSQGKADSLIRVLCCMTLHEKEDGTAKTAKDLFEILSHIRNKHLGRTAGGVYVDQRVHRALSHPGVDEAP